MPSRTDDLKPAAQAAAARLASRYGSLKHMLSAAVLAFEWLSPELREVFMARADGQEADLPARPSERHRIADLFLGTCPAELEAELLAVVQGQRPLDGQLMDQIRLGIERGLHSRYVRQQRAPGKRASRRGR